MTRPAYLTDDMLAFLKARFGHPSQTNIWDAASELRAAFELDLTQARAAFHYWQVMAWQL